MSWRVAIGVLLSVLPAGAIAVASSPDDGLPLEPARYVEMRVSSGTWMSLTLSPDGRTMIFDMLGDLYAMPARGGEAKLIAGGMAYETQAAYSPDGEWIAFISDRSGADNLWIARPDGSDARRLSASDDTTIFVSPEWSADGGAIFVSRYRADTNNYSLWRYSLDGDDEEIAPIRDALDAPREEWRSTLGAAASPNGRHLYFARRVGRPDFDAIVQWTIVRRDLSTDEEVTLVAGSRARWTDGDTFFRPRVSPDGRLLAYATRSEGRAVLRVRDLASGHDMSLGDIGYDQVQASSWQDIVPRYSFTPDGSAIIVSHEGRFERRPVHGGKAEEIPFSANVRLPVGPSTRIAIPEDGGPVGSRLALAPIASPNGQLVAYSAFGAIYVKSVSNDSEPVRLPIPDAAYQPAWSPDGKVITYVTWSEADGGLIWTIPAEGTGAPRRVSELPAYYSYPVFTPDGAAIIAVRSAMSSRLHTNFEVGNLREAELVSIPTAGGTARVLTRGRIGARPHFSAAKKNSVFILAADGLNVVDLSTGEREHFVQVKGPGWYFNEGSAPVDDLRLSPDGKSLLAQVAQQLHLVAAPTSGGSEIDLLETDLPHRQLTDVGADYFEWGPDGAIDWSVGSRFVRARGIEFAARTTTDLTVRRPRDRAHGTLLLRGGKAFTMADGDRIIDDADILIVDGRIAAVGPRGGIDFPADTQIRDISGKFVLPGFVDVHDHIGNIRRNVLSQEDWALRARLAFGVTTAFDPSTLSIDMLAYQDLLDAGLMLGPRLRSTGPALFSFNRFKSLDQVRAVLSRYRDAYHLRNIKVYRTGNRRVRQWLAMAARELGLLPTAEGALSLKLDMTQIQDGLAGQEHAIPTPPLGDDVLGLLDAMRTSYVTTLMVLNGGAPGVDWFIATDDPLADAKIRRFWPPAAIEQKLTAVPWQALPVQRFPAIARDAAALAQRGGLVGIGAHGDIPGIGFHWELEAHTMGGMKPMAVLHAATAGSAEAIGRLGDLGTIESGKLADLVVLDADPIADIRNSRAIDAVMLNGRLYNGDTLAVLWPEASVAPTGWFARPGAERWLPAPGDPAPAAHSPLDH